MAAPLFAISDCCHLCSGRWIQFVLIVPVAFSRIQRIGVLQPSIGTISWRLLLLGLSLHQAASVLFPFVSLFHGHSSTSSLYPRAQHISSREGPACCVKSHHARSDLDANDNMSLHSFTFSPVILFTEYWRLDSYLEIVPQDRCSCLARTSASLNRHQTSTCLVVRVVEHPVYGQKLIDCFTSTTPVGQSPGRVAEHSGRIGPRRFLLPTDDPVWFLATKSLQVFFSFLQ